MSLRKNTGLLIARMGFFLGFSGVLTLLCSVVEGTTHGLKCGEGFSIGL